MKIIIDKDGNLEFPDGIPVGLTLRSHQNNGGNKFIPKQLPCIFRQGNCGLSDCKKRAIFEWYCIHFNKQVTPKLCEGCNARQ